MSVIVTFTDMTLVSYQEELLSVSQMSEVDSDLSSNSSFYGKCLNRQWISQVTIEYFNTSCNCYCLIL